MQLHTLGLGQVADRIGSDLTSSDLNGSGVRLLILRSMVKVERKPGKTAGGKGKSVAKDSDGIQKKQQPNKETPRTDRTYTRKGRAAQQERQQIKASAR